MPEPYASVSAAKPNVAMRKVATGRKIAADGLIVSSAAGSLTCSLVRLPKTSLVTTEALLS